jgi:hypothetical protein
LSSDEFWQLTLRELDILIRRRMARDRRLHDYPAQLVCLYLVNIYRDRDEYPNPLTMEEVFPDSEPTPEEQSDAILARFRLLTAMLGGVDKTKA